MIFKCDDSNNKQKVELEDKNMQDFSYFDKINQTAADVSYVF